MTDQQNSQPSDAGDRFRRLMNADEQVELDPTIDKSIEEKEPTELASETDSEAGLENGDDTGLENSTRPNETEIQLDELNSTQPEPAFQPEETSRQEPNPSFLRRRLLIKGQTPAWISMSLNLMTRIRLQFRLASPSVLRNPSAVNQLKNRAPGVSKLRRAQSHER